MLALGLYNFIRGIKRAYNWDKNVFWSALTVNYFNTSLLINSTHNLLVFEISLGGRGGLLLEGILKIYLPPSLCLQN